MVCIAQYLTARFLPYDDLKEEEFEFWLLFCLSTEFISSYFFAFLITDEIHYSFLSLLIFLPLSYHPTFIPDIFNFCFLDKIPNTLCSGFFFGFFFSYVINSALSYLCHEAFTFLIYILLRTDTLSYELP